MVKNNKNMGSLPHSFYHLIGDLDIKSHRHILKYIISKDKSYKEMVFVSIRIVNAEVTLSLGQGRFSLGYYTGAEIWKMNRK